MGTPPPAEIASERPRPLDWRLTVAVGGLLFVAGLFLAGEKRALWLPGVGLGMGFYSWFGPRVLPLLAAAIFLGLARQPDVGWAQVLTDGTLRVAQVPLSWWLYHRVARGARGLDDPRSATVFMILVPGVVAAGFAAVQAGLWQLLHAAPEAFGLTVGKLWLSRALGILGVLPTMLVFVTPLIVRRGWVTLEPDRPAPRSPDADALTFGDALELVGLCLGNGLLALVLVWLHLHEPRLNGPLWGVCILLIVWTSMRQGLRGGSVAATFSAVVALSTADALGVTPDLFSPLQGNLLAQSSVALLVGASASWIRLNEARYRHLVGHIPVLLYSVRLPRGIACPPGPASRGDLPGGAAIGQAAEVILVSPASAPLFGCPPADLTGPYQGWLARIEAADRELVVAALSQLCLQRQPVTCEYRVRAGDAVRWVRDTLAPHYDDAGRLDGWDGVCEDVTEPRELAHQIRRTTGMLQALVTHLPAGVFFVQGPHGTPLLVNARARQLLGQREDLAAGVDRLSDVYRLRRPDGSPYPAADLPIVRALRDGVASMADDIVIHRADGRLIPLVTWAAPVDLGSGRPDAAVWVLEDLTALHQSEAARRGEPDLLRARRQPVSGPLTNGTAHDLGALFAAVLAKLPPGHPARPDLDRLLAAEQSR